MEKKKRRKFGIFIQRLGRVCGDGVREEGEELIRGFHLGFFEQSLVT
jgi:hypothetical protein